MKDAGGGAPPPSSRCLPTVLSAFAALKEGDAARAASCFIEKAHITVHWPKTPDFPVAGEWRGPGAARGWVAAFIETADVIEAELTHASDRGDAASVTFDVTLHHTASGANFRGDLFVVAFCGRVGVREMHLHIDAPALETAIRAARLGEET